MLNAEKFKKEISECIDGYDSGRFSISKDCTPRIKYCDATDCNNCMLSEQEGYCSLKRIKWLLSEYKEPIKLSRLEYDILKYLSDNTAYLYIVRESTSNLFIYRFEPTKGTHGWNGRGYTPLTAFNKLFLFIKWEDEESTPIKDVLGNCEVVEYETKWIISKY